MTGGKSRATKYPAIWRAEVNAAKLPKSAKTVAWELHKHMRVNEDDDWFISYPRSRMLAASELPEGTWKDGVKYLVRSGFLERISPGFWERTAEYRPTLPRPKVDQRRRAQPVSTLADGGDSGSTHRGHAQPASATGDTDPHAGRGWIPARVGDGSEHPQGMDPSPSTTNYLLAPADVREKTVAGQVREATTEGARDTDPGSRRRSFRACWHGYLRDEHPRFCRCTMELGPDTHPPVTNGVQRRNQPCSDTKHSPTWRADVWSCADCAREAAAASSRSERDAEALGEVARRRTVEADACRRASGRELRL